MGKKKFRYKLLVKMPLTRSQLIAGDKTKGPVLTGQVQGVKQGSGVSIANDGTISFNASSASGVVKTNNINAFNGYVWPQSVAEGGHLTLGADSNLSWVVRRSGYGITEAGGNLKVSLPIRTNAQPEPAIGAGQAEAINGSLYWNSTQQRLFICNNNDWVPATYEAVDLNSAFFTGSYILYVNPETGSDIYKTDLSVQRLTSGYSLQTPFKTLQRAALEVARLQQGSSPEGNLLSYDRFVIKCSAGRYVISNGVGDSLLDIPVWADGFVPSLANLEMFNSQEYRGVILPRGVSVIGDDLRKTIMTPSDVPPKSGNIETDRGSIFRITGGAFFFNFTFKDNPDLNSSHHLLDCFSFTSDEDLEDYYNKTQKVFAQGYANDSVEPGETEIVAPQPAGTPDPSTDGVQGSSPYIFNCSIRSSYGLCGINADGSDVTGFRSMVVAQFTGTSLQKDMYCWQRYNEASDSWVSIASNTTDYNTYFIGGKPDNIRMNPDRLSFHIRAINDAFIQEVSVFAIGQGIHHWVHSGGEVSITNSNSSFGGCAAIAEGYKTAAFPQDKTWNVSTLNVAFNMSNVSNVITKIPIGTIAVDVSNSATTLILEDPLIESKLYAGVPQILADRGYTLKANSYLWVENPEGDDWRAPLASNAWAPGNNNSTADRIIISQAMETPDNKAPGDESSPGLAGKRVYIRRLVDIRSFEERKYSLDLENSDDKVRTPPRDYVVQTQGNGVNGLLPDNRMVVVNSSGSLNAQGSGVAKRAQIVLSRANSDASGSLSTGWLAGRYYRPGDTVRLFNKHYTCILENSDATFDSNKWVESYVHMPSDYNAYDYYKNVAPTVIFDDDTDGANVDTDSCGWILDNPGSANYAWKKSAITNQYRTSTDYKGVHQFLVGLGFSSSDADTILLPKGLNNTRIDPAAPANGFSSYILGSGAATSPNANWGIEFRRPSIVRLFGHAWEWAGYLNYTKALPAYQKELSPQNQFTYFFTNYLGGRVYATGYNQEGLLISPAGVTDLTTGETQDVTTFGDEISAIDVPKPSIDTENFSVGRLTVTESQKFGENAKDRVTARVATSSNISSLTAGMGFGLGVVRLASVAQLESTLPPSGVSNASIEGSPDVVTIQGLNYWKLKQRITSSGSGVVNIYVDCARQDNRTTLNALLDDPPIIPSKAVPTLARAAQYANAILAGSDQIARINILAGVYNPASTWDCNVQFRSFRRVTPSGSEFNNFTNDYRVALSSWTSDSNGANDYFDGTGYGTSANDINDRVILIPFRLQTSQPSFFPAGAKNTFQLFIRCQTMIFNRGVNFSSSGFIFLGVPHIIKLLGAPWPSGALTSQPDWFTKSWFVFAFDREATDGVVSLEDWVTDPTKVTFDSNTSTNFSLIVKGIIDYLNALNVAQDLGPLPDSQKEYDSRSLSAVISLRGLSSDASNIYDCVFGPGVPTRKDLLTPENEAYITTTGFTSINVGNIYLRGNTRLSKVEAGLYGAVPLSGTAPYSAENDDPGSGLIDGPSWVWTQFFHTFFSLTDSSIEPIRFGSWGRDFFIQTDPTFTNSKNYFADRTGKLLPNHVNLRRLDSDQPATTDGPFFDQFILAKAGIICVSAWSDVNVSASSASVTETNVSGGSFTGTYQGFFGRFGSNTYNTVKTRLIRLGGEGVNLPEASCIVNIGRSTPGSVPNYNGNDFQENIRSIIRRADVVSTEPARFLGRPNIDQDAYDAIAPGRGWIPSGTVLNPDLPSFSDNTNIQGANLANPSTDANLNVGMRVFKRGIDTETANVITNDCIL